MEHWTLSDQLAVDVVLGAIHQLERSHIALRADRQRSGIEVGDGTRESQVVAINQANPQSPEGAVILYSCQDPNAFVQVQWRSHRSRLPVQVVPRFRCKLSSLHITSLGFDRHRCRVESRNPSSQEHQSVFCLGTEPNVEGRKGPVQLQVGQYGDALTLSQGGISHEFAMHVKLGVVRYRYRLHIPTARLYSDGRSVEV